MNQDEISKLVGLRKYIIECHNNLDGKGNNNSLVKQHDVAYEYSRMIKMTDSILKEYVNFE